MRFYNIEVKGKMMLEKRTSHPTYTSADQGRLYYCQGYMYIISDLNTGGALLCTNVIWDGLSTDFRYGQLWASNTWEGTCNNFYRSRISIYDTQPTAGNPSLLICRNSPGYPAAGVALQVEVQTGVGVYGCSESNIGVQGRSISYWAVAGNTAYWNYSSKYIKHLESVCLSNCVREKPLSVYKYYWEDTNSIGFNQSIGPLAEEFDETFNVNNNPNKEEYDGVWTVDGAAFGLALENLKEIDKLKEIIVEMYSCIKKLENKEI